MDPALQDLFIAAVPQHLPFRLESIRRAQWHTDSQGFNESPVERNSMGVRRARTQGSRAAEGQWNVEGD